MNKNLEMMKKLIDEKKKNGNKKVNERATKNMGTNKSSKGVKTGNGGGLFD
ncbi:MAG: hypothetical protein ACRC57_08400 [Sarcina sp.]